MSWRLNIRYAGHVMTAKGYVGDSPKSGGGIWVKDFGDSLLKGKFETLQEVNW